MATHQPFQKGLGRATVNKVARIVDHAVVVSVSVLATHQSFQKRAVLGATGVKVVVYISVTLLVTG
jgi:hypothetical protein